jgi:hypothetical protein
MNAANSYRRGPSQEALQAEPANAEQRPRARIAELESDAATGGSAPIHYVRMFTDSAGNPPSHKQPCLVLDGLKKYVSRDPQHGKFCADIDNTRLYTNLSWPRPFFIYISQSGNPAESPSPAAPRPGAGQPRLVDGFVRRRDAPLPLRDNRVRWNNVKMNAANSYRRGSNQPRVPPGGTCQRRATTRTDGCPHCRLRERVGIQRQQAPGDWTANPSWLRPSFYTAAPSIEKLEEVQAG